MKLKHTRATVGGKNKALEGLLAQPWREGGVWHIRLLPPVEAGTTALESAEAEG